MIGINDVITGVLAVIVGSIMIGLVAYPIVNMVLDDMDVGEDDTQGDLIKTLLGIAVVLLCITLIVFPIYLLTKSKN